jgi:ubiquinone/menaquinone biosynthesis C-methylase UbiE
MSHANGEYGEGVWEKKIRVQDEVGVISGTVTSISHVKKDTINLMKKVDKIVLPLIKKNSKVLDAGCGPLGRFSVEFSRRGCSVVGCDISDTTLKFALNHSKKTNSSIKFVKDDLTSLKNVGNNFDLLFCYATFYHIPPHLSGISLIRFNEVLRDGGYALVEFGVLKKRGIKDLFYSPIYWTGHYIKRIFNKGFKVNISRFSEREIDELIKLSGFEKIKRFDDCYLLKKVT